jgi:hypothetical protein
MELSIDCLHFLKHALPFISDPNVSITITINGFVIQLWQWNLGDKENSYVGVSK